MANASNPTLQALLEKAGEVRLDQLDVLRADDSPIADVLNLIIEAAIHAGTSDVHIEPRDGFVQVRYRIDGLLRSIRRLPSSLFLALTARIKVLADLQVEELKLAQTGRFRLPLDGRQYTIHVSTLPIADGEKVVLHIIDESNQALTLEALGLWGQNLRALNAAITQPHGLVLVSGPSGSGISTTLYAILASLNSPRVNIATIEDPVDYHLPGINQTQVNQRSGMTIASGLKAILQQDPNIIMISDLCGREATELALQAAGSGRLVCAGQHADTPEAAIRHCIGVGSEPFLVASTVRAAVGQRLVRRLCTRCRQEYKLPKDETTQLLGLFGIKTKQQLATLHELEQAAIKEGVGKELKQQATTAGAISRLFKASEKGCNHCAHTGYRGSIGIYEVLAMSDQLQRLIVSYATSAVIQQQAMEDGMLAMKVDGLVKVLRGLTSIEEVVRVTSAIK